MARVRVAQQELKRPAQQLEDARDLPHHDGQQRARRNLEQQEGVVRVVLVSDPQRSVHHQRKECVHGIDVVQHVRVAQRRAHKEYEKVEPPHHLGKTRHRKILAHIVVAEVAEAGHPHVAGDVQPDGVVLLGRVKVVVQQEENLHPPLPLLCDVAVEQLARVGALVKTQRCGEGAEAQAPIDEEEHVTGICLLASAKRLRAVAHDHVHEQPGELDAVAQRAGACHQRGAV
mmetsp:Transcript_10246/g.42508  ORF Transcript_10246/g.42508 Transcript_10246/m.42508 type:complete len:230 (-) Transcript_10246:251-940(-)